MRLPSLVVTTKIRLSAHRRRILLEKPCNATLGVSSPAGPFRELSGSQSKRNHRREARTRAEEPEEFLSRASPKRVGRAFALLTRTYHGCRQCGSNPARALVAVNFRVARHSGRMLSLTCERSRIRQDYGLGRRQQVSAIRLLSERSDPRVNQRLTSSGSSRRFSYVLFVLQVHTKRLARRPRARFPGLFKMSREI